MSAPPLVIVAAVARNGVIGSGNAMPWHLPGDFRHFRALTMGKPLIMGRKTFASIGRALPGRETIVLTRDPGFCAPGVRVAHALEEAVALAAARAPAIGAHEIIVAGGGELYAALIGRAKRLEITQVDLAPDGDARFPAVDPARWRLVARSAASRGPGEYCDYAFATYERVDEATAD